jgi:hypothetical protein
MELTSPEAISIIDYYHPRDRKLVVRIDAQRKDFLHELSSLFRRLANGEVEEFRVESSKHVLLSKRVRSFLLRRTPGNETGEKVTIRCADPDQVEVRWESPASAWQRYTWLLQGVIDSPVPCHQYFSDSVLDDAEVEIALGERRPSLKGLV